MSKLNYWIWAVEGGLEDCGADGKLTAEEVKSVAEAIMGARENESLATGTECIQNPLRTEIEELKRQREKDRDEADRREGIYQKSIANRYGGSDSVIVRIDGGRVEVEPRT